MSFEIAFLPLLEEARATVAPLLRVPTNEVVFVPNATTAVNTVLRNLVFEEGDVIVHFSTAYGACEKTIDYVCETTPLRSASAVLEYLMEDTEVVQKFIEIVRDVYQSGGEAKIAMFDTLPAFPGVRMPWHLALPYGSTSLVSFDHAACLQWRLDKCGKLYEVAP